MSHNHAIVWMDSKEAHIFQFDAEDVETQRIQAHLPFAKIHHKAGVIGAGHIHLDHDYFDEIAKALNGVQEWLLTGPGAAKHELSGYLKVKLHGLRPRLLAIEAADHPSDAQLLAHARRFFKAADRLQPNSPAHLRS